jgi:hypothetical protein
MPRVGRDQYLHVPNPRLMILKSDVGTWIFQAYDVIVL